MNTQKLKTWMLRLPGGMRLRRLVHAHRFYRSVGGRKAPADIFSHIYEANRWGENESLSGSGSTVRYTENIRREIPRLIAELNVRRLLDAPCGDFNWFRLIPRLNGFSYLGGDIVPPLVQKNQNIFGDATTRFIELDIIKAPLPVADLWLCRDALFHFSYDDIFRTIRNFLRSDIRYLLTSTHSECRENVDIPTGSFRLLNLELPPFNLGSAEIYIDDWIEGFPVRKLGLWEKDKLGAWLANNSAFRKVNRP